MAKTKVTPKKAVPAKKATSKVKTAPASKAKTSATSKAKSPAAAKKAAVSKSKTKTAPVAASKSKAKTTSKAKSKATGGQNLPRDLNEHGFVKGSASEKIVLALLEGGTDRRDVNAKIRKALGGKTRNGTEHNVSSLAANLLKRLKDKGYTIESSWRLVEPTPASKAAATRRAKKATTSAKAAPSKAKVAKKAAPKKRTKK